MAELRAALTMLWMNPKHHQGVALSQVKDELKQSAKRSLSEHLLGYGKLSQLFTAPELAGSGDLFFECHDVLLFPPFLLSAKEHCATPSTTCSSLSDDSSRGPFARGRYTERARTGCTPIPSRTSSRKVPAPAASETSSVTASPPLTFASSKVSNISSVPTADGLAGVQAPGMQVPSPLLLPDLFNMPPPLLPGVPFVNALCL